MAPPAKTMPANVLLTRTSSVAEAIERLVAAASQSVDAALYRLNHPRLAGALEQAAERGVRVRLVLDRGKYEETRATRELLAASRIPFRLASGRGGPGTKMHHKFALLDRRTVLIGSYNWTLESEEQNFEGLVVLSDPEAVAVYQSEFAALWNEAVRGE
jgi:phosphatidylserine/phosphatidylglycerophosphate/cardiolipin synthase-like enzyme